MEVSNINDSGQNLNQILQNTQNAAGSGSNAGSAANSSAGADNPAAVFDKSDEKTVNKPDQKAIDAAIKEANDQSERLRLLIEKLLNRQGNAALKAEGLQWNKEFFEKLEVDEETAAQAAQEVSEDGYYGVKQTSQRILDFAKALSGGDPSKIDMLRDAVEKGFKAAEDQWGDKLPELCYQTLDAVRKGFDDWAKEAGLTA